MDDHKDLLATDTWRDKIVFFAGDGSGDLSSLVELDLEPAISWNITDDFNSDGYPVSGLWHAARRIRRALLSREAD